MNFLLSEMQQFIQELETLNGGTFNIGAEGMIISLMDVRESLNYHIPQLLTLLQRDM